MGAGQIGGVATLLDIDFHNAAGFIGVKAEVTEAQYIVYFMSHAMMFCVGSLIEAHVVLTTATCVKGEKYRFEVFGGTHKFLERSGIARTVEHLCVHRGYNSSLRWESCSPDNLALLVLGGQYFFHKREHDTEYIMNRLRYGAIPKTPEGGNNNCRFYGWGSRRNGYLVPLLISLRRVDVTILPSDQCLQMWNFKNRFLCIQQYVCKSSKHGALCPDDLGGVIECSGFLRGMMVSRLIDRPCGIGFLDMSHYLKFITCGVDDSRDIIGHNDYMEFEFGITTVRPAATRQLATVAQTTTTTENPDPNDPGPPKLIHPPASCEDEKDKELEANNGQAHDNGPNGAGDSKKESDEKTFLK